MLRVQRAGGHVRDGAVVIGAVLFQSHRLEFLHLGTVLIGFDGCENPATERAMSPSSERHCAKRRSQFTDMMAASSVISRVSNSWRAYTSARPRVIPATVFSTKIVPCVNSPRIATDSDVTRGLPAAAASYAPQSIV